MIQYADILFSLWVEVQLPIEIKGCFELLVLSETWSQCYLTKYIYMIMNGKRTHWKLIQCQSVYMYSWCCSNEWLADQVFHVITTKSGLNNVWGLVTFCLILCFLLVGLFHHLHEIVYLDNLFSSFISANFPV